MPSNDKLSAFSQMQVALQRPPRVGMATAASGALTAASSAQVVAPGAVAAWPSMAQLNWLKSDSSRNLLDGNTPPATPVTGGTTPPPSCSFHPSPRVQSEKTGWLTFLAGSCTPSSASYVAVCWGGCLHWICLLPMGLVCSRREGN